MWIEKQCGIENGVALSRVYSVNIYIILIKIAIARFACVRLNLPIPHYQIAWETLRTRYDNSTALRRHHLNSLLDLPPIVKQSQTSIREFVDDANSHLAALKSLGEPVEHWDSLIVALLFRKLDQITIREWEKRVLSPSQQTHL